MTNYPFAIHYEATSRTFHLQNDNLSYIMMVDDYGKLLQLYFGKPIQHRENFSHLFNFTTHAMSASILEYDSSYSYENVKQEFPDFGATDLRSAAVKIRQENGATVTDFRYQSHRIFAGKENLAGLPASYVENPEEAWTLEIQLLDALTKVTATLSYTLFAPTFGGIIARSVKLSNNGNENLQVERLLSLSLDLPDKNYEWVQLAGAWAREREIEERPLAHGSQAIYSLRGHSSPHHNPFAALKRPTADETQGEVIATTFVYSGNFLLQAEVNSIDMTRLQLGIHPEGFSWQLLPGTSFQAPEALLVYTDKGLNQMSATFHKLLQKRVARGQWRDQARPILLNNWEATYFDFTEEKLLAIAQTAKEVGIELFVLDDGWFGQRTSDRAGLGDWTPNQDRLPNGIAGLSQKIADMGLKFGLWFEPEMVNKDSQLYRQHPDWIIHTPHRQQSQYRNQYVLNFAREEVVENIYQQMAQILREAKIDYVKWDMNRSISEAFDSSRPASQQGEIYHRYILGVYALYERLTSEFPQILFESCASGGGRFDAGMLYYAPQAWTSDNSDAICRLKIQYGTSLVYPVSAMGAHVSMTPNHQVGRMTPLSTRAAVALFGTFGYELDLNQLTSEEIAQVKEQIAFMKEHRDLLQFGRFYRLRSPFATVAGGFGDGNDTAWMVVAPDQRKAIVGFFQILNKVDEPFNWVKLAGLAPDKHYTLTTGPTGETITYTGDELMAIGIDTRKDSTTTFGAPETRSDFSSRLWVLEAE